MTKDELVLELRKVTKNNESLEQRLKIAEENVETHKRASFEQNKKQKELQLERDTMKREVEKLEKAYNIIAELFDEYIQTSRNYLKQFELLSKASVMLEQNLTQKIKNFNQGVEEK